MSSQISDGSVELRQEKNSLKLTGGLPRDDSVGNHAPGKEDIKDDDDDDSVQSTKRTHGAWQDDPTDLPWNGCVCGEIHARPIKVFWIQCEGPCQAWFNVWSKCVQGLTAKEAERSVWYCPACWELMQRQPVPLMQLFNLPQEDVFYKILQFVAKPTYTAGVLLQQLAPLNRTARHILQGENSRGLWATILQREYQTNRRPTTVAPVSSNIGAFGNRRSSKRRRKRTNFLSPCASYSSNDHPRHAVQQQHFALLQRTEDVYYQLEELADLLNAYSRKGETGSPNPRNKQATSLTPNRLRKILEKSRPMDVNRPSPATGRTLLQVVCAGEMSESVIVACVRYLVEDFDADPNVLSCNEAPYANRPALYFGIARAMPNLVQTLVSSGASLSTKVAGKFKMTFDTTREISGEYTPLQYAQAMHQIEVVEAGRDSQVRVPPYWVTKLNAMIRLLAQATEDAERAQRSVKTTKKLDAAAAI